MIYKKHNRIYNIQLNRYGNVIYNTGKNWKVTKYNNIDAFIKSLWGALNEW